MSSERSYDYLAKNTVRNAWMRLLPEDLSAPNDFGFYLPAQQNLELDGYLAKGMVPSRLLCAENNSSVYADVQANARGVRLINGSIQQAIDHHRKSRAPLLRFANMDLDGSQHTVTEELLALASVLPARQTSYLAVTSYAARDGTTLQQGTMNTSKFFSGLPDVAGFMEGYGSVMRRYEHLLKLIPHHESTPLAHFQRELALLWWIVLMFGCVDKTRGYHHVDRRFINVIGKPLRLLSDQVQKQMQILKSPTSMVFVLEPQLRNLLRSRQVHVWIDHIERYAYWSTNRQPMRTWHFRLRPVSPGEVTLQDLLAQVWDLATSNPLIYVDKAGKDVRIT